MVNRLYHISGSKFRIANKIVPYVVTLLKKNSFNYCEPFFGGGAIFLNIPADFVHHSVINDKDKNIINLWQQFMINPEKLSNAVETAIPSKDLFDWSKTYKVESDNFLRAIKFWYATKFSFYSTRDTFMITKTPIREQVTLYNDTNIGEIYTFYRNLIDKKASILNMDYKDILKLCSEKWSNYVIYADPPYYGTEFRYSTGDGEKFNHEELKVQLKSKTFILSYNDCEYIRKLYSEFKIIDIERVDIEERKEILILSEDIKADTIVTEREELF